MTTQLGDAPRHSGGEQRFCGQCGRERYAGDFFCAACGQRYPTSSSDGRPGHGATTAKIAARRDNARSVGLIMCCGVGVTTLIALAADSYLYYAISHYWDRIEAGRYSTAEEVWAPRAFNAEDIRSLSALVGVLFTIAALVALTVWLWRVIAMLEQRGDFSVGFGRSAAIWSWFAPFVNLIIPPLIAYRAGRAVGVRSDVAGWAVPGVVLVPVAYVLMDISSSVEPEDLGADLVALWLSVGASLAWMTGAALIARFLWHARSSTAAG